MSRQSEPASRGRSWGGLLRCVFYVWGVDKMCCCSLFIVIVIIIILNTTRLHSQNWTNSMLFLELTKCCVLNIGQSVFLGVDRMVVFS